jgi:hypothetical protein
VEKGEIKEMIDANTSSTGLLNERGSLIGSGRMAQ